MLRWIGALGLAAAFGIVDERLTGIGYPWFWVSNMSALWLLLAFGAGAVQRSAPGAAVLGLVVTMLALVTYYGPGSHDLQHTLRVAQPYVAGGLVIGPVFGVFGYRWRRARGIFGALVLSAAFCLEPLAWRHRLGFVPRPTYVWDLEVLTGLVLAAFFAVPPLHRRKPTS